MERFRWSLFLAALSIVGFASAADNVGKVIDTRRSFLVIHVGKAGLFSAAAHEHWINAPIASGSVDDASATPGVQFVVEATKLAVMADKNVSSKDLAHVQFNMQTKVLESSKYPDIVFQSTRAQGVGGDAWKVDGHLTLHGLTKPVTVEVKREKDAYVGAARIKQTDFGIQPIQIGGGVVKVKNELEIRFEVYTKAAL
jgi:polyisoprenoid-binding protein YceI